MDRKWMVADRLSEEYENGVREFIDFALTNAEDKNHIPCPCWKCLNYNTVDEYELEEHLTCFGIDKSYTCWTKHGERKVGLSSNRFEFDFGHRDNVNVDVGDDVEGIPTVMEEELIDRPELLERLKNDAKQPLWDGCKFTKLDAVIALYNLKAKHGWTDSSFTDLLSKVKELLPDNNVLPQRTYDAKQMLSSIGLKHQRIHACVNDCILFRMEYGSLKECPKCNASRYKNKGYMPAKVMYYFPLLPRLRRMYRSADYAKNLTWHYDGRIKDGKLRHPADAHQWKSFDAKYPVFAGEPRNLRFALSADGMNPHGVQSNSHSTWPIIMAIYNLPPWLCMKRKYLMLSTLISGPKQPGNDIDVYLAPLIDELKVLWEEGIDVYDGLRKERFNLRAMLFGTVNDFPAYENLSGYSVKGQYACPKCEDETDFIRLQYSKKEVYMGHRRFLPDKHEYRKAGAMFNGKRENRGPPTILTGQEVFDKVKNLQIILGKENAKSVPSRGWKKCSIFWELTYWKDLNVRHFIDLMHQEKNVTESCLATLLGVQGKTKDTENSRKDLIQLGIREELRPVEDGTKTYCAPAAHTLSKKEKKVFCQTLRSVKVPEGYSSNIKSLVSLKDSKLKALKSHDCHIIMENLIPVAIRSILPKEVRATITRLCFSFKAICSKVIDPDNLSILQAEIVETLCEMEMYFPPSFFDIIVHLTVHLVEEIEECGPPTLRWMYPFERYMKVLKGYVKNRSRPEGCIAERYLMEEAIEFCSEYMSNVEYIGLPRPCHIGKREGQGICGRQLIDVEKLKLEQAHLYVLYNTDEVGFYIDMHKELLEEDKPGMGETWLTKEHNRTFVTWFQEHITRQLNVSPDSVSDTVKWLSRGPRMQVFSYNTYTVNGYTFCTKEHDENSTTQNSGVTLVAEALHISSVKDVNPIYANMRYYGVIEHIWELDYVSFQVPVFGCMWVENNNGVQVDESDFLRVDLNRVGYKDDSFILASQAQQVFYISDPVSSKWSIVLLSKKIMNTF